MIDKPIFIKDIAYYKENRSKLPLVAWIDQAAFFLHKQTNDPIEQCREFALRVIKNQTSWVVKNPKVEYYLRDMKTEDKTLTIGTLHEYFKIIHDEDLILAPSMTAYVKTSVKKSFLSGFTQNGLKVREIFKRRALDAEKSEDDVLFGLNHTLQTVKKRDNNSISGLLTTHSSPIYMYSGHYTLTSTTRSVTSIGNTTTEKMVGGKKLYRTPQTVYDDINATLYRPEFTQSLRDTIRKYNLYLPTAEEVSKDIYRSSKDFWTKKSYHVEIRQYLEKFTPEERAVFTYAGSFLLLRKYNSDLVREVLSTITSDSYLVTDMLREDKIKYLKSMHGSFSNLLALITAKRSIGFKGDYIKIDDNKLLDYIFNKAKQMEHGFTQYSDLIKSVVSIPVLPSQTAYVKQMMRSSILLSDTDSTGGFYQEWVKWYFGDDRLDPDAQAIASVVMFITTESIAHHLKILSANMNIEDENFYALDMKNEFGWLLMAPLNVSKHYWGKTYIKEGYIFPNPVNEIKGVHLIASSAPESISKLTHQFLDDFYTTIYQGKKISINHVLFVIMDLEKTIINNLKEGDLSLFNRDKVQKRSAYSEDMATGKTNYFRHLMWQEGFGPTYGLLPDPPYVCFKINTTLTSKTKTQQWISNMENKKLARDITKTITKYEKNELPTLYIATSFLLNNKLPKEIIDVVDFRRVCLNTLHPLYLILDILAFPRKEGYLLIEQQDFLMRKLSTK